MPVSGVWVASEKGERLTNVGIARRLRLTPRTVETQVGSILGKLDLATNEEGHRRVLAVLSYLGT